MLICSIEVDDIDSQVRLWLQDESDPVIVILVAMSRFTHFVR